MGTINRAQSEQRGRVVRGQGQGQRQAKMNSKSFCAKVLTTILVICSSRQRAWAGLDWPGMARTELVSGTLLGPEKDAKTITTTGEDNNKDNDRRRFQRNLFALR